MILRLHYTYITGVLHLLGLCFSLPAFHIKHIFHHNCVLTNPSEDFLFVIYDTRLLQPHLLLICGP